MFHELGGDARKPGHAARVREQRPLTIAPPGVPAALRCCEVPPARQEKWSRKASGKSLSNRARYERNHEVDDDALVLPRDNSWHGSRLRFDFICITGSVDQPHDPRAGWTTGLGARRRSAGRECDGCHRGQSLRQVERLEHCRDACRLGTLQTPWIPQYGILSPYVWACTTFMQGVVCCRRPVSSEIDPHAARGNAQGTDRDRLGGRRAGPNRLLP